MADNTTKEKINKYNQKLSQTSDPDKMKLYQSKLDYYNNLRGDEISLQKPERLKRGESYQLKIDGERTIKAIGYGTDNKNNPMSLMEFDRRAPLDNDIVVQIAYCGVCHSDWHVILNEWQNSKYPVIVGHEITGKVVRKGKAVSKFNVGDLVAVGPNYNSCRSCSQCKAGFEQYCQYDVTETYNMPDRKFEGELNPTGPVTYGGYANIIVVHEHYALKLPQGAPLDKMAPVLCAGATMYTPLKYMGIDQNSVVGIAGIGGLGHIGIKLAKAFGAKVVALTRTPEKLSDSKRLGADVSLLVTDMDSLKPFESKLDLIIDTIPFNHDLDPYLMLLKPNATLWVVGSFFSMVGDFNLINRKGKIIRGSSTAGIPDTQEVIDFCHKNSIYPDVKVIGFKDLQSTHRDLINSKVYYRYVVDVSTIYS